jgi:hypothetical protein
MKTPSSSGKKKKKNNGVSPGMDLTRFGFSVKKRSASEVVASPPKSASAKNNHNNAGKNNNEDDSNMESPLKRHKASPLGPAVNNLVGKGKENGTTASPAVENDKKISLAKTVATTTAASRTALFDLTQSTSSEEGPSTSKDGSKVVSNNDATAKNEKMKGPNNVASLGGLASSIANQIVAASSFTNNMTQQQPEKQRRGKRDKDIPKPRSSAISTTTSAVVKPLSPTKTKSGNNNNHFQALALVRVIDPHEITCFTAVANTRRQGHKQQQQQRNSTFWTPQRIFNGAILGRSSSSANAKPNFVDLGIGNNCMGISRNHITVLTVRVKSDHTMSTTTTNTTAMEASQNLSQESAVSSSTRNSSNSSQCDQSTVTIQVCDNASNGVNVHRTKRGSRKVTFLSKGEKMTLRVGDAIEFYSNEKLCYCVVGLESSSQDVLMDDGKKTQNVVGKSVEKQTEVIVVAEDEKKVSVDTAAIKKRDGYGGLTNGEGGEKKKRNLKKMNVSDEVEVVDAKKQSIDAAKALKTPRNGSSNGTNTSAAAAKSTSVEEVEDTPRFPPAATSPISHVKSATKTTVAKCLDKKLQKSPMGPKSPKKLTSTASSDENKVDLATVDAAGDDLEIANVKTEQQNESEMIKKGDTVKARFEVKDWFGESQLEWYFGTVTRVKKGKMSSSTQAYEIDILYADQTKDTLPFPDDDVVKVDDHTYPDSFFVGDSVDCFHQDGLRPGHEGRWYRGRIASMSEDGSRCDVLYIDGDVSFFHCDVTLVEPYVLTVSSISFSMNPTSPPRRKRLD